MMPRKLVAHREPSAVARCQRVIAEPVADGPLWKNMVITSPCNRPLTFAFRWVGSSSLVIACPEHGAQDFQPVEDDPTVGL